MNAAQDSPAASLPLAGLTALSIGVSTATGMAAKILRGLGAEVQRTARAGAAHRLSEDVERYLCRGIPEVDSGAQAEMLATADIVITEAGEDGLDVDGLVRRGAIVAEVSSWGESGPRSGEPAGELVIQSAGGLTNLVGEPGREPLVLGGNQVGYSAGMQLFSAIMIALTHRDRTGEGQVVRTSLLETVAYLQWKGAAFFQADGTLLARGRSSGPVVLPCSDGHLAFYYRDTDWNRVLELFGDERLGDERFATTSGRAAHLPEVRRIMSETSRHRGKHDLYHAAQALGIPVGSVETVADILDDDQYAHQRFLITVADGDRSWREPTLPFTFNNRRFHSSLDTADAVDALTEAGR
jgi:crotonobetainyl-CoA:carnitine CoA-transferase CaiB-like acyl-CoA transferase